MRSRLQPREEDREMKRYLGAFASVGLLLGMLAGETALAQKPGGVLKMSHFDSPASMSLHEEATAAAPRGAPTLSLRALSAASRSLRLCGAADLPDAAARAAAMLGSSCSGCVGRSNFAFAVAASAEARSLAAASCIAFSATVILRSRWSAPPRGALPRPAVRPF